MSASNPLSFVEGLSPLVGVLNQLSLLHGRTTLLDAGTEVAIATVKNAENRLGHYQAGWEELHDATKEDRVARGFPANEPLLRTGQPGYEGVPGPGLQGSLSWEYVPGDPYEADFIIGVLASSLAGPYAAVQELGSLNLRHPIPARPFLLPAFEEEVRAVPPSLLNSIHAASLGYANALSSETQSSVRAGVADAGV